MRPYPPDADTVLTDLDDDLIDRGPRTQPMRYRTQEPAMSPNAHQLRAVAVRTGRTFQAAGLHVINLLHPDPIAPPPMSCSACAGAGITCPSPQACRHELVDGRRPAPAVQTPAPPCPPVPPAWGAPLAEPADVPGGALRLLVVAIVVVLAIIGGVSLLAGKAQAATVVGLHTTTWHDQPGYRSSTPGLYLRADSGATLGALRNSVGRASTYAGWTWHTDEQRPVSAALTVGLVTGYALAPVLPLVAPSVRIGLGQRAALRLIVLPRAHEKQGATAVNVALEWQL